MSLRPSSWFLFLEALGRFRRSRKQRRAALARRRLASRRHLFDRLEERVVLNADPVAYDDSLPAVEDVAATGVVTATDADQDALTYGLFAGPTSGSLTFNSDGTYEYTPNPDFNGVDSFSFVANDGIADSNPATVSITVDPVNDYPKFNSGSGGDISYWVDEDDVLNESLPAASDIDGDGLTYAVVSGPASGALALNSDGSFTYTPYPDYNGGDSFVYSVSDGTVEGVLYGTVTITVNSLNDAPTVSMPFVEYLSTITSDVSDVDNRGLLISDVMTAAIGDGRWADRDGDLQGLAVTNLAPDGIMPAGEWQFSINDGATWTAVPWSVSASGLGLALAGDGLSRLRFVPNSDFHGVAAVNFHLWDASSGAVNGQVCQIAGYYGSDTDGYSAGWGRLELQVTGVFVTDEDTALTGTVQAVGLTLIDDVDSGTLTLNLDGTFTYMPNVNSHGQDSFRYQYLDFFGVTQTGTVNITVNPVNDAPTFDSGSGDTTYSVDEDCVLNESLPAASDIDGDVLSYAVATGPTHGSLTINPDGTFSYTPHPDFNGEDSFNYTVSDDSPSGTLYGTVTITIHPVNDAPTFTPGAADVPFLEDAGSYVGVWASNVWIGPANEIAAGQTPIFEVTADRTDLFLEQPSIGADGTLYFKPAPNQFGTANVTVVLRDFGGTDRGGSDASAPAYFTISINPVNDAPTFTPGAADVPFHEDSGSYIGAWASDIWLGPDNEFAAGQTPSFEVSVDRTDLFLEQPWIGADGMLHFTPAGDQNGTANVTVVLRDGGGTENGGSDVSAPAYFTITILPVNDAPTFTPAAYDVPVNEDSGPYAIPWAGNIMPGPTVDEANQTLMFQVTTVDRSELFSEQPWIGADGILHFTPVGDANGIATVTVVLRDGAGIENGGNNASAPLTFTITINPVNDPPTFTPGPASVVVNEDRGPYSEAWASGMSAGVTADEVGIPMSFEVTVDRPDLFLEQPWIGADGILHFTPAADQNGVANVTVVLRDTGGTANGGIDASAPVTLAITINSINDAPTFVPGSFDIPVTEDSGPYAWYWANLISAGPSADEVSQSLNFELSVDRPDLFQEQPSIGADGILRFSTFSNQFGTATVTVALRDNGGTADGGIDVSPPVTFTITISPVNDAPTFAPGNSNITVEEDSGPYSGAWASSLVAGPTPDELNQTMAFEVTVDRQDLFSEQPWIGTDGTLYFTPASNQFGTAIVTAILRDNGGTADGGVDGSTPLTFTITISPINDAPVADPSFESGDEDTNITGTVSATDVDLDSLTYAVVAGSGPSNGTLTFYADGSFTYTPNLNFHGTDSFDFTASDGTVESAPATVTITVNSVNDAPTAVEGTFWTTHGEQRLSPAALLSHVSADDVDVGDAAALTVGLGGGGTYGTLVWDSMASEYVYTPNGVRIGDDMFELMITDPQGGSITVDFTFRVENASPIIDPLVLSPELDSIVEDVADEDNPGTSVGDWLSQVPWASLSDSDVETLGIAVTMISSGSMDTVVGTWWFRIDDQSPWQHLATALEGGQALLLAGSARLKFVPEADSYGTATLAYRAWDRTNDSSLNPLNGTVISLPGYEPGAAYSAETGTVGLTVHAVNDAPTFTAGGNVSVTEGSAPYSMPWATGVTAGADNELSQPVWFVVNVNTNPTLFTASDQPTVVYDSVTGTWNLQFTPAPERNGTANITIRLYDDANGDGIGDAYSETSFTITVNDLPIITLPNNPLSFNRNWEAMAVAPSLTLADGENDVTQVTIQITAGLQYDGTPAGSDLLVAPTPGNGITWHFDAASGMLSGSGAASIADYQAKLREVKFQTSAAVGTRTLSFRAYNGTASLTAGPESTIDILVVGNGAPIVEMGLLSAAWLFMPNQTNPGGHSVGELVDAASGINLPSEPTRIFDPDENPVGLALVGSEEQGAGTWQYRLSVGSAWIDVAIVDNHVLLLDRTAELRFLYNGVNPSVMPSLTFRAWDQTWGTSGVNLLESAILDQTCLSSEIGVLRLNRQPTVTVDDDNYVHTVPGGVPNRFTLEDVMTWTGAIDPDGDELHLAWQYLYGPLQYDASTDEYVYSTGVDALTDDSYVLRVSDSFGAYRDVVITFHVNNAPVIAPNLVYEPWIFDPSRPTGSLIGQSVGVILDGASAVDENGQPTTITDANENPLGMALVGGEVQAAGTWQYRLNGGMWTDVAIANNHVLLLDREAELRFLYNGVSPTAMPSLTFRAWDQTWGTSGDEVVAGTGGGSSSFSERTGLLQFADTSTVQPFTHAMIGNSTFTFTRDELNGWIGTPELVSAALTYSWMWNSSDDPIDIHEGGTPGTFIFDSGSESRNAVYVLKVEDLLGGSFEVPFSIRINDAPVLVNSGLVGNLYHVDVTDEQGATVCDLMDDYAALKLNENEEPFALLDSNPNDSFGMAIVGADLYSFGKWQYRLAQGSWQDLTLVTGEAILLDREAVIRFKYDQAAPDTKPSLTFHAWDQTSGTSGEITAVPTFDNTSAFSNLTGVFFANRAPVAHDVVLTFGQGDARDFASESLDYWFEVSEPDGESLAITLITDLDGRKLSYNPISEFYTYEYEANAAEDVYQFEYSDAYGGSVRVTLTFRENNAPNALYFEITDPPTHGTLHLYAQSEYDSQGPVLHPAGSFTYTPDANWSGADEFKYRVHDGRDYASTEGTVTITVTAVSDAPVAAAQSHVIVEEQSFTGTLAATDVETTSPTFAIDVQPTQGIVTLDSITGEFTYTPNDDAVGTDVFTYRAMDVDGNSTTATVTFTITNVNDAPVAHDNVLTTAANQEITFGASDLLADDVDGDNDGLQWTGFRNVPQHGSLRWNTDGSFTYVPQVGFVGLDSFQYLISDGHHTSEATVWIQVGAAPAEGYAPVARSLSISLTVGNSITARLPAGDVSGAALAYSFNEADHGTVGIDEETGTFTYTPDAGFWGTDTFTYRVSKGTLHSNYAIVTIAVASPSTAVESPIGTYTLREDAPLHGVIPPFNPAINHPVYYLDADPAHGTVLLNGDGSFTYEPDANYHGADSFTYYAFDSATSSYTDPATVYLEIVAVVDATLAQSDVVSTAIGEALTINPAELLEQDLDADGDAPAVMGIGGHPQHGVLTLEPRRHASLCTARGLCGARFFPLRSERRIYHLAKRRLDRGRSARDAGVVGNEHVGDDSVAADYALRDARSYQRRGGSFLPDRRPFRGGDFAGDCSR